MRKSGLTFRKQRGLSLVELMIAMLLGLMLIGAVTSLFMSTLQSNRDLALIHQLEDELHATMDLMTRDLRRAGSNATPIVSATMTNPFGLDTPAAAAGEVANSCFTFRYDLDNDGALDAASPDERFGFRLLQKRIQSRGGGLACNLNGAPGWTDVTTANVVEITKLNFALQTTEAGEMDLRRIVITLEGQLKSDPSVKRSLLRTLRVRNDAWTP